MLRVGFVLWFGMGILARIDAQTLPGPPQPLAEAAPALARGMSSLLPRRATVSLEFQALAPVAPAEWSSFRGGLLEELRKLGVDIRDATQPEWRARVTVSENARGLLLVGEIINNGGRQIVMAQWARPAAIDNKPGLRIQMTPIAQQSEPILDVWMSDSGLDLLLLSPAKVTALHLTNGTWIPSGQASLALAGPVPRDARGRMEFIAGSPRVFLPGTTCTGQVNPQLLFTCTPSNAVWPSGAGEGAVDVRWVSGRNVLESEGVRTAFYNEARGWFASSDGKIETRAGEAVAATDGWGSDLAPIESSCGSLRGMIVASAGDSADHDQVQAFSMTNEQPSAASGALSLAGAVTALWAAERPAHATLVIHNAKTGNYEASRLALACAE